VLPSQQAEAPETNIAELKSAIETAARRAGSIPHFEKDQAEPERQVRLDPGSARTGIAESADGDTVLAQFEFEKMRKIAPGESERLEQSPVRLYF